MADQDRFEARLAAALDRYADESPERRGLEALAESVTAGPQHHRLLARLAATGEVPARPFGMTRSAALSLASLVLLVALVASILVGVAMMGGSPRMNDLGVVPTASPTPTASATMLVTPAPTSTLTPTSGPPVTPAPVMTPDASLETAGGIVMVIFYEVQDLNGKQLAGFLLPVDEVNGDLPLGDIRGFKTAVDDVTYSSSAVVHGPQLLSNPWPSFGSDVRVPAGSYWLVLWVATELRPYGGWIPADSSNSQLVVGGCALRVEVTDAMQTTVVVAGIPTGSVDYYVANQELGPGLRLPACRVG